MSKVLNDHKRLGKRFIPPLLNYGKLADVSWTDMMVPDLIWIALVNENYGKQKGAEIIRNFYEVAKTTFENDARNFCNISFYENISHTKLGRFYDALYERDLIEYIQEALYNFIELFPECPFKFIFKDIYIQPVLDISFIISYKKLLLKILDKTSTESTFVIGNVIYSMLANDRLKIQKDSVMAKLPELKDYPKTDISRMIASSNRATINIFFGEKFYNQKNKWIMQFWQRSIDLEPCKI